MATPFDKLYSGIALPLVKRPQGIFSPAGTIEVIKSSLTMILMTLPGERVNMPKFGSRLWELVGEPIDEIATTLAYTYTVVAIQSWENRVKIVDVLIDTNEHLLRVGIAYYIIPVKQQDYLELTFPRLAA